MYCRFGNDDTALGIDEQFMWGPAVLISPVLFEVRFADATVL